jgi:glycosyltransferase involved in cell wall biosynthesis
MKIVVVGLRGIPGIMGGVETHCEELLPRIAALAPDLQIEVVGRIPYTGPAQRDVNGVMLVPLPSPVSKSGEAIVSTLRGIVYAKRSGADLVHIHAIGPALLVPLARLLGLKVVMTHHGADYDRDKWGGAAKAMLRLGERLGIGFAHAIVCVAPSLRASLAARFPTAAERLVYIPNGAATLPVSDAADSNVLATLGLIAGNYCLAVARLVPEKGLSYLIDAHTASGTPRPLVIAGGEMHGDGHADMLRAKAGRGVMFTGALPRDVLGVLYRNTALFVMPSFHEGLPIAALEAMASGAPMAMSDISANRDLGLSAGHYLPVGNAEAWADALGSDLARFATAGTDAGRAFDWPTIAADTLAVYRGVTR